MRLLLLLNRRSIVTCVDILLFRQVLDSLSSLQAYYLMVEDDLAAVHVVGESPVLLLFLLFVLLGVYDHVLHQFLGLVDYFTQVFAFLSFGFS